MSEPIKVWLADDEPTAGYVFVDRERYVLTLVDEYGDQRSRYTSGARLESSQVLWYALSTIHGHALYHSREEAKRACITKHRDQLARTNGFYKQMAEKEIARHREILSRLEQEHD